MVWQWPPVSAEVVALVHQATHQALAVLQSWLGTDRSGMLVVVTRGRSRWLVKVSAT